MPGSALLALPTDLALSVVRLLRGHDLVAVCLACRAWEMLVRSEEFGASRKQGSARPAYR